MVHCAFAHMLQILGSGEFFPTITMRFCTNTKAFAIKGPRWPKNPNPIPAHQYCISPSNFLEAPAHLPTSLGDVFDPPFAACQHPPNLQWAFCLVAFPMVAWFGGFPIGRRLGPWQGPPRPLFKTRQWYGGVPTIRCANVRIFQ